MAALVTCATGFVGRAFVKALRAENEPTRVLIRDQTKAPLFSDETIVVGDVFDPSCVQRASTGVETVVHVPPQVYPEGGQEHQLAMHRRSHVETTRVVLEAAVLNGVTSFVFVSSAHATGRNSDTVLCESTGDRPATPYGQAKLEAEALALSYADRYSMNVVILRPPEIYGPGDKGLVSALGRAARRNLWLPLRGVEVSHSLIFVDNLARAGLRLLNLPSGQRPGSVFIVKDPSDYRPEDLYVAVCRALGKSEVDPKIRTGG